MSWWLRPRVYSQGKGDETMMEEEEEKGEKGKKVEI
jgi:hypothetical protein